MLKNIINRLQSQVELVGLDIGTASVKLVRLLKDLDGYTAKVAVRETIGVNAEGERSGNAVVTAVKNCLKRAGLNNPDVVCGISGSEVVVRGFKFPPLPDAAVEQAVRMEAQQVCPFDSKQIVLDYQLIENPEVSGEQKATKIFPRRGVMVASTENVIKEKTTVLAEAGAKPLLVDSNALALINCLNELDLTDTNSTIAIIDIGWEFTNVIVYGQDGLPFVRDLRQAGRQVIQEISKALELSEAEVQQALTENKMAEESRNKVLLTLNNAIRPLATAINETLRFHSFQEKNSGVKKIFLCGGFSLVDTFVEFLSDAMPVETRQLNPFEKIKCDAGVDGNKLLRTCGPDLAVAAGLAMRTI